MLPSFARIIFLSVLDGPLVSNCRLGCVARRIHTLSLGTAMGVWVSAGISGGHINPAVLFLTLSSQITIHTTFW